MPGKSVGSYEPYISKLFPLGPAQTGVTGTAYSPPYRCHGIPSIPLALYIHRSAGGPTAADHSARICFHQDKSVAGAEFFRPIAYDADYAYFIDGLTVTAATDDYYWALRFPVFPGFMYCRFAFVAKTDTWDVNMWLPGGGGDWREPPGVGDPDGWGMDEVDDDP